MHSTSEISEDFFSRWTDAQRDLWDSLSTALPTFEPPEDLNLWREVYLSHIVTWERTVRQSLETQRVWLAQWSDTMVNEYPTSLPMDEWRRQVQEVVDCWLAAQQQLWDRWFSLLKGEGYSTAVARPLAMDGRAPSTGDTSAARAVGPYPGSPLQGTSAPAPRPEASLEPVQTAP
ncbi:MAG: hypothetical protein ACFCBW_01405, partial [Candidatus Competibacterales bacterium]